MGLIREDGTPKPAVEHFDPRLGICQWFHFDDHRLDEAVEWLRILGVTKLRTGISWADWQRADALEWFDRQMAALADFDTTITLCFTPEVLGKRPHHTSPPAELDAFARFARAVVERYARPPALTGSGHAAAWAGDEGLPTDGWEASAPPHVLGRSLRRAARFWRGGP